MVMDIRWIQRFSNYRKALSQLKAGVEISKERSLSDLEKQGIIQSFEYTHELAWKTLKDLLEYRGNSDILGSRDATREAFSYGIISNGDIWMGMIRSRNLSSHTYNQDTAEEIVKSILTNYYSEFQSLSERLEELKKKDEK